MRPKRSGSGHAGEKTEASALETTLGYRFQDPSLLGWALTHRSLSAEIAARGPGDPREDNEQLEFLGDAVLGLVTVELLVGRFSAAREGELTRMRASLVSRRNLAAVGARLGLGDHLRLGRGEDRSGGRAKPALLANAVEAVLAAVYLDSRDREGLTAVRALIDREIVSPALSSLEHALAGQSILTGSIGDHKSALQERLQAAGQGQPHYVLAEESGPDHRKLFRVEVYADLLSDGAGHLLATAEASSKKEAQQLAARRALEHLAAAEAPAAAADQVQDVA